MKILFKTSAIIFGIASITIFSCIKDKEKIQPDSGPTTMAEFYNQNNPKSQYFSVNCAAGDTLIASKGTKIRIPENAFKKSDGTPVVGTARIEVKEIFSKADMILADKVTVSYGQILISGGELYISATQNGEELLLNNKSLTIETPTENVDTNMSLFTGVSSDTSFTWIPAMGTSPNQDSIMYYDTVFPYNYIYTINNLGWINCDYFYNNPDTKYNLTTSFSSHTDEVVVYYAFKDIHSVVKAYDYDKNFEFEAQQIPRGQTVTVIALGVNSEGKYFMGTEEVSITNNTNVILDMTEVSKDIIMTTLNDL